MNFGIYKEKREEKQSKLFKEKGAMWKIDSSDNDDTANGVNGNKVNGSGYTNQPRKAPSIKDITGISLPYIGAYKKLDNTKQVVALIDDVSNLPPSSTTRPHAVSRFRICALIAVNAIWHAPIPVIKPSISMLRHIALTWPTIALDAHYACQCAQLSIASGNFACKQIAYEFWAFDFHRRFVYLFSLFSAWFRKPFRTLLNVEQVLQYMCTPYCRANKYIEEVLCFKLFFFSLFCLE